MHVFVFLTLTAKNGDSQASVGDRSLALGRVGGVNQHVVISRDVKRILHCSHRGESKHRLFDRAREVETHETHEAPRGQKEPPLGARPGVQAEPGPQRSDRTVRRSSGGGLPTLGLPVLAGASGEVVDSSSLRFLVQRMLEELKNVEERRRRCGRTPTLPFAGPGAGRHAEKEEEEEEEKAPEVFQLTGVWVSLAEYASVGFFWERAS